MSASTLCPFRYTLYSLLVLVLLFCTTTPLATYVVLFCDASGNDSSGSGGSI
ncbi:hypothetical protein EJ04DRAFT_517696 [Polyplosphaeria fusca]|uniref:Uncharacterized protein n=1 Tax=Polyplosphaeria fusca TaxID=682080 RepID=A0A9P4QL06_9PLEO|nr:hypothetical protein EJ04DRAFT_517696 [Polyplosphaeria fusca]